ncbi:MAG: eukaryotic-like serine/threonine-protein kinase [Pyrinomonadaceae bacterium]|jgi:serine/threonine-protein kinase|nr:eukaryotic-like serine/threonine-protein kinase [Pyrinomonadaceae bacterium]
MIGTFLRNYKILEKLGVGGQGTVYKATDGKLGRTVVVKVLPPELTAREANLRRFEREARLASSLDHPNICTIFDLDEVDGVHFIAMQYVEGRNVRQLVGGHPLELKSALLIGIQVTDALAAAHSRGVIHRDIKSGNVMVTPSGQVKILDFGLAKLLDDSEETPRSAVHRTDLTEVGVPYGTATYAAPEQARGDRVDKRADIFSTGVLLYEMLTGTWPFRGKTTIDVRHAVLHDAPRPVAELRNEPLPASLQQILDRCLAKEPRHRYQKMEELRDDLRGVLQEVSASETTGQPFTSVTPEPARHLAGASPVSRAMRWLKGRKVDATSAPGAATPTKPTIHETPFTTIADQEKKSLAILCFRNLSNDPATSFYEFSLADAVITELARVRSLAVRPSSVIAKYQGGQMDPREIGQELKVNAVLAAGFMHAGGRFRVTAQLLDVATGDILWSDRIDTSDADIIAVQDTIAQRIVEGLRLELSPAEQDGIAKPSTQNAAAYEQYLRGRDLFARFIFRTIAPEDCAAAIEHFQRAIELDPKFALAHDGLGAAYVNRVFKGFGGAEDYERAEVAFEKALSIDPKLVEARMLMVFIYLWRGQKQKAREEVARARKEAPDEPVVHFVKATLHRLDGEYGRALRSYERLMRLDPAAHIVASYNRALVYMYMGNFEETARQLDHAGDEDNPLVKTFRALSLYYTGKTDAAAELMQGNIATHPNMHGIRPFMAMFLSAQGKHEEALAQLTADVIRNADVDADIAYSVASVYALEGMQDEAFEWLARAIALGNENRPCFEHDPNWAALKNTVRFQELMAQVSAQHKADGLKAQAAGQTGVENKSPDV